MLDIRRQIGNRIKELRKNLKLTQEEIGERIDLQPGYIGQIERGEKYPSLKTLVKLAQVLEINVDYFIKHDENIELPQKIKSLNQSDLLLKKLIDLLKDKDTEDIKYIINIAKLTNELNSKIKDKKSGNAEYIIKMSKKFFDRVYKHSQI